MRHVSDCAPLPVCLRHRGTVWGLWWLPLLAVERRCSTDCLAQGPQRVPGHYVWKLHCARLGRGLGWFVWLRVQGGAAYVTGHRRTESVGLLPVTCWTFSHPHPISPPHFSDSPFRPNRFCWPPTAHQPLCNPQTSFPDGFTNRLQPRLQTHLTPTTTPDSECAPGCTWSPARATACLWESRPWSSQTGQVIQGLR